jgi:hypothetical protein
MKYERTPMKPRNRTGDGAPRDKSRTTRAKQRTVTLRQQRAIKRALQGE